jgi:hypothetical protein
MSTAILWVSGMGIHLERDSTDREVYVGVNEEYFFRASELLETWRSLTKEEQNQVLTWLFSPQRQLSDAPASRLKTMDATELDESTSAKVLREEFGLSYGGTD